MTAVPSYSKVLRIAAHVENCAVRIQGEDSAHCAWKVTFRREAYGFS